MGFTMTEKILGKASGNHPVHAGEAVLARLDVFIPEEPVGYAEFFYRHNLKVWDPDRVIFCMDHFFQEPWPFAAITEHPKLRQFAQRQGIPPENIYDVGRHGISHQVPVEEGWVLPGTVTIAGDTQAPTMGAINCFATAALYGTVPMLLTGDTWFVVPEAIQVNLHGQLRHSVLGKDIALHLLKELGGKVDGCVIEFDGQGIASLPIDMRMGTANGATHWGALAAIFPADQILLDYITPRARYPFTSVSADRDAHYVARYDCDLGEIDCLVAGPHRVDLIRPVRELQDVFVTAANIGSCSSGRLEDLKLAAEVLQGRKIDPKVRMVVTPISTQTMREATKAGLVEVFLNAGATVTTPGCGACWSGCNSLLTLGKAERCISSSVENLPGRMGHPEAEIYLGNPAVVAASAIEGRIADPAPYLSGGKQL